MGPRSLARFQRSPSDPGTAASLRRRASSYGLIKSFTMGIASQLALLLATIQLLDEREPRPNSRQTDIHLNAQGKVYALTGVAVVRIRPGGVRNDVQVS